MKKVSIISIAVSVIFALSACSHEELADETLPYGKYPVTFTATGLGQSAQTRATVDGTWDKGDAVAVAVDGINGAKKYITDGSGQTVTLTAEAGSTPFCWESTQRPISVSAWYCGNQYNTSLPSDWSVNENQSGSGYNQSDFLYAPPTDITYNGNQPLNFYHQTAKVVVNIRNYGVATNEPNSVNIRAIKDGGFDVNANGNFRLSAKGTTYSSIQPQKLTAPNNGVAFKQGEQGETALASYQALVIPQTLSNSAAIEINIDGYAPFKYIPTGEWKGCNVYTYNISVEAGKLQVTTSTEIGWTEGGTGSGSVTIVEPVDLTTYPNEVYTVAQNAEVVIDGKGQILYKRLVINNGARVTLKNVKLYSPEACYEDIIGVSGNVALIIKGENEVRGSRWSAIAVKDKGTLTIEGSENDKLTVTSNEEGTTVSNGAGCLCAYPESNIVINGGNIIAKASSVSESAGIGTFWATAEKSTNTSINITINGGIVYAEGGKDSPGIGSCNQDSHNSGNILITGGNVTAISGTGSTWGGAGIGSGSSAKCGNITITGGTVIATSSMCTSGGGAGIGSGDSSIGSTTIAECGDIHITGLYTKVIATTENPSNSDDIGRGNRSYCGVVNIDGGANVTATNNKIYEF